MEALRLENFYKNVRVITYSLLTRVIRGPEMMVLGENVYSILPLLPTPLYRNFYLTSIVLFSLWSFGSLFFFKQPV